tara:strand:- start:528 stop:668 length:141 start_codon:yes stop_codon:yes gene_type:complete
MSAVATLSGVLSNTSVQEVKFRVKRNISSTTKNGLFFIFFMVFILF